MFFIYTYIICKNIICQLYKKHNYKQLRANEQYEKNELRQRFANIIRFDYTKENHENRLDNWLASKICDNIVETIVRYSG